MIPASNVRPHRFSAGFAAPGTTVDLDIVTNVVFVVTYATLYCGDNAGTVSYIECGGGYILTLITPPSATGGFIATQCDVTLEEGDSIQVINGSEAFDLNYLISGYYWAPQSSGER